MDTRLLSGAGGMIPELFNSGITRLPACAASPMGEAVQRAQCPQVPAVSRFGVGPVGAEVLVPELANSGIDTWLLPGAGVLIPELFNSGTNRLPACAASRISEAVQRPEAPKPPLPPALGVGPVGAEVLVPELANSGIGRGLLPGAGTLIPELLNSGRTWLPVCGASRIGEAMKRAESPQAPAASRFGARSRRGRGGCSGVGQLRNGQGAPSGRRGGGSGVVQLRRHRAPCLHSISRRRSCPEGRRPASLCRLPLRGLIARGRRAIIGGDP